MEKNQRTKRNSRSGRANLAKVAELRRYGVITGLEKKIKEASKELLKYKKIKKKCSKKRSMQKTIAEIVAKWTGIPVQAHAGRERRQNFCILKTAFMQRMVEFRKDAVKAVAERDSQKPRRGCQDERARIGSFYFSRQHRCREDGTLPKGAGGVSFHDENSVIRIDMSRIYGKIFRLKASSPVTPPGYVGYEEGGQLTEAVRRSRTRSLLLDEIEKAHPEIFNVLLQIAR